MSCSKKDNNWHPYVTEEKMREYLLTWIAVCGDGTVSVLKSIEVDTIIGDTDELCWSKAVEIGFITRPLMAATPFTAQLTDKAYTFLKGETKWQ